MRQREMEKYTDRTDVTADIALYEYGFIRNPKTDETICCINTYVSDEDISDWHKARKYELRTQYITFNEVYEALEDISDGYYSFIGSDRETELAELANDYLTCHIQALTQYDGSFQIYM